MINLENTKKTLLRDKDVLEEYERQNPEFLIAKALVRARMKAKMTQKEVALRMCTSQTQVSRLESGEHMPSLASMIKYSKVIGLPIAMEIRPDW